MGGLWFSINKRRILIACEYSGRVRESFAKRGWDAWSCDLLPSDVPGQHFQGDVREMLKQKWDMMIAFPPCTYLCSSGMHWTTRGMRDHQLTEDAIDFVKMLFNADIEKIALENPVGVLSTRFRKPDQIVYPWMFGDDASKNTCLWKRGLPNLTATRIIPPARWQLVQNADDMVECECCGEPFCPEHNDHYVDCACLGPTQDDVFYKIRSGFQFGTLINPAPKMIWGNQTPSGQNKLGLSENRWKERSETFLGIAEAMGEQWGSWSYSAHPPLPE